MPDVGGIAALDVAIGLIFAFFVLSIACSAINELISSAFKLRARNLQDGIRSLLDDPRLVEQFFEHPRVKALMKPGTNRLPSYIPSRVFATTVLDTLAPVADSKQDLVVRAQEAAAQLPASRAQMLLSDALAEAGNDRDRLRASIERSFDEVMDRAGGWYKRRVQLILTLVAVVLVGCANADAFTMAERLWKDDALRAAVVTRATEQTAADRCQSRDAGSGELASTAACVDEIQELGIPLGWTDDTTPAIDKPFEILGKLLGLLITIGAVSLGAPFWFDLMSKVARLRATGGRADALPTSDEAAAPKS